MLPLNILRHSGHLLHARHCSGAIVRFSDNSSFKFKFHFNSFCWCYLLITFAKQLTVWTPIRRNKMLGLIWIVNVNHSDGILKYFMQILIELFVNKQWRPWSGIWSGSALFARLNFAKAFVMRDFVWSCQSLNSANSLLLYKVTAFSVILGEV